MKRRLLTILLAITMTFAVAGYARADDNNGNGGKSGDNLAYAVNTTNGATVVKTAFAIRHVMNGIVDQANGAIAYASCTDCTTVAIAIEIVLVESTPKVVTPQNAAVAVNELCSLCVTVANALQFVVGTDGPVRFDEQGKEALDQIRDDLEQIKEDLKDGKLTLEQLNAKVEEIRLRIREVLAKHLVPAKGRDHGEGDHVHEDNRSVSTTTPSSATNTTTSSSTPVSTSTDTTSTPTTTTGVTTTTGP